MGSLRYTKKGKNRYGSAIFVNDVSEQLVDVLRGTQRNQSILLLTIGLGLLKILSANVLGLFITVPVYFLMYFFTEKKVVLSFTRNRLLYASEYKFPRLVKGSGNTLVVISLVILIGFLFPSYLGIFETSTDSMIMVLAEFGLSNILLFQYQQQITSKLHIFHRLDVFITLLVNFWYAYQFVTINYEFKEINHCQISEQLVHKSKRTTLFSLGMVLALYFLTQFFLINRFIFILPVLFYVIFLLLPRPEIARYSIFGPLSRPLIINLEIQIQDYIQLERITAATFGWASSTSPVMRKFPLNLIPSDAGRVYKTGIQTSLKPALKQANILGFFLTLFINLVVVISLLQIAIQYVPSDIDLVLFIGIGLLLISIVFYLAFRILINLRMRFQHDEALIIGQSFLARYIGSTMWIISGNKLQGTSVQRGGGKAILRYDKIRGIQIRYRRLLILLLFSVFAVAITLWNLAGAINFSSLIILVPFFFDLGIDFLVEKYTADLSFFIIAGYVLWGFLMAIYPGIYTRNNPTLYLDLQSASITPIVLRDFEEQRDASIEFTKSLISSSRPPRRKSIGRPGVFELQCSIVGVQTSISKEIEIRIGPHEKMYTVTLSEHLKVPHQIIPKLRVSAMRGYPSVKIQVIDIHSKATLYDEMLHLGFEEARLINCEANTYAFTLEVSRIGQKS